MAERIEAGKLEGMSKRELVDLIQSVSPLDLLQVRFCPVFEPALLPCAHVRAHTKETERTIVGVKTPRQGIHSNLISIAGEFSVWESRQRRQKSFKGQGLCMPAGFVESLPERNGIALTQDTMQEKVIALYNKVFDEGLVTSAEDRDAARLAKELEQKAKIEEAKVALKYTLCTCIFAIDTRPLSLSPSLGHTLLLGQSTKEADQGEDTVDDGPKQVPELGLCE